ARPHALLAARLELRRDGAAHHGPLEREALAALQRLDAQRDLGELTRAAGLLLVTVAGVAGAGDRLAVGDGGGARVDVDAVALLEHLRGDLEVDVAHAPEHGLARVGVALEAQPGVGLEEP